MLNGFTKDRWRSGLAVLGSTVAKSMFGLGISAFVALKIDNYTAASYFQLLTLQSAFITFVSGAAFVRGAMASGDASSAAALLRFQFLFVAASLIFTSILLFIFLPGDYLRTSKYDLYFVSFILLFSAAVSSINGLFQGFLVNRVGRYNVFKSTIVANAFGFICLSVLMLDANIVLLTGIVLLVQLIILFQLFRDNAYLRQIVKLSTVVAGHNQFDWSTAAFGISNTLFMIVMFAIREVWKENQTPQIASDIFFILRISDTAFQVPAILLGSNEKLVIKIEKSVTKDFYRLLATTCIIVFLYFVCIFCGIFLNNLIESSSIIAIVIAQILVDFVRLPSAVANLILLMKRSPWPYFIIIFCASITTGSLFYLLRGLREPISLYFFLIALAAWQLVGAILTAKFPRRRAIKEV